MRLLALLFCLLLASPALAGRVALVLGNSAYRGAPALANAATDAGDVAAALQALGFRVYLGQDLTRDSALRLVQSFAEAVGPEDLALFYFSGHGVQIGAENYLLPIDADGRDEAALTGSSLRLQAILRTMELRAGQRIVLLDACRTNPFAAATSRSLGAPTRGLARVEAGVGSFIAYATQPGNVAYDGQGRNSPFTTALLSHLDQPGADIHEMMRQVRTDVVTATGSAQVPWENSSLVDRVFLAGAPLSEMPPAQPMPAQVVTPQPAPQPAPQTMPQTTRTFGWVVAGLDPKGDGFLALRDGTSPAARRLAKLPEGTPLDVLAQDGPWRLVRLADGRTGWAHSNWIRPAFAPSMPPPAPVPTQPTGESCDQLWYARNALFAARGYCFTSPRGRAAFPNPGCIPGLAAADLPFSPAERAEIARLQAREAALGCN